MYACEAPVRHVTPNLPGLQVSVTYENGDWQTDKKGTGVQPAGRSG